MSEHAEDLKGIIGDPAVRSVDRALGESILAPLRKYWWVQLVLGAAWLVLAVVVLKFNHASVVTVGVLTGVLFLAFAAEEFALAALDESATKWLWGIFGVILAASGVVALVHPVSTFVGFAEILGFVFLLIGIMWMVQAFTERAFNDLWWLSLVSGILMIVLAFWTTGEFFLQRAYTLLVFAGIWALMKGITDIVRAFQLRELGD
ncbi:MAG TPA: DUF308 domain-containing protein [Solirubrobacteraceae bacterium]|nr:DUF308 domain-containing protein [Solirubrobacteraceae bacterium]